MPTRTSFTFKLSPREQQDLTAHLQQGNYRPMEVPYTSIAAQGADCTIALYTSGKCVVQGKGAEEWVTFTLEPQILGRVGVGYEDLLNPELSQPHIGIDESGKGDFFGPMVIAAAYVDPELADTFKEMGVRDSKNITSDTKAQAMAKDLRKELGARMAIVQIGPESYNRLYRKMGNVNNILAWGHARAIENILEAVPGCPRAVADQFGPKRQVEQALMKQGKKIKLEQRPKAESDPAVAAASILARGAFLYALRRMRKDYDLEVPKGASAQVRERAVELVKQHGPQVLLKTCKCHFKTTDQVLEAAGYHRRDLGPDGAATSKAYTRRSKS